MITAARARQTDFSARGSPKPGLGLLWPLLAAATLASSAASAVPVTVSFAPETAAANVGDTIAVELIADIPDPVLGWGLDVGYDTALLGLVGSPLIGSDWIAGTAADGDGLAALAFPDPVAGSSILLATLTFEVLGIGTSPLEASVTSLDPSEGFALAPPALPGSFASLVFDDASITGAPLDVPEPGTLLLTLAGMAVLGLGRSVSPGFRRGASKRKR